MVIGNYWKSNNIKTIAPFNLQNYYTFHVQYDTKQNQLK